VPKPQAVKNIIATPAAYGIVLPKVDNQPYFVTIRRTRDIDVQVAAKLAELPMDEFKALNPQFNKPVIVGGTDTQILLPKSNAEKFKTNLGKWTQALSSWTAHKVTTARERIETIAARFRTTPEIIREVNNIPPRMVLKAGSTILVPRPEEQERDIAQDVAESATMAMEPDHPPTRRIMVKVGRSDTLASIAARNGVSVDDVKSWNKLSRDSVSRGQSLSLHVANQMRMVHAAPGHSLAQRARVARIASVRLAPRNMPKTALVDSQQRRIR